METKNVFSGLVFIVLVSAILTGCVLPNGTSYQSDYDGKLKQFTSLEQIEDFLAQNEGSGAYNFAGMSRGTKTLALESVAMDSVEGGAEAPQAMPAAEADESGSDYSDDYSETNIQVEGVDEADIIKNDGKYIYYVSDNVLYIVDAYPAEDAKVLSELEFENGYPREIFINGDKLVVMGYEYREIEPRDEPVLEKVASGVAVDMIMPRYPYYGSSYSFVKVYDISDREDPEEEESIAVEGNYFNSRMIGDYVYVIINKYAYSGFRPPIIYYSGGQREIPVSSIYYFDIPDNSYQLSIMLSVDLDDNSFSEKTVMKGYSQEMYVSQDNIYLINPKQVPYYYETKVMIEEVMKEYVSASVRAEIERIEGYDLRESTKISEIQYVIGEYFNTLDEDELEEIYKDMEPELEEIQERIAKEREKTIVNRFSIDSGEIEFEAQGEVPGRVLNQFSMDEHEDYFRIATTTGQLWRSDSSSKNHIYVLDMDLDIVGKLEDLAPGESIYSARFMGERAYLVTFKKIDPLFVIDLSEPDDPSVLGKLKIPGYSDYLHPYDEDHIIGIGKETLETEEKDRDFVWQQGVKMSLFDVSDVEHPKEISKVEIGDRGTDSDALHNHKAFLFSRSKNLLVIPIRLAEIDEEKYDGEVPDYAYGDYTFQGAYVYNLDLEDGFQYKGRITHVEDDSLEKSGWYYYSEDSIVRSLYMDDVLYTISSRKIKANDLSDLEELNEVVLREAEERRDIEVYDDEVYPMPAVPDVEI